MVKRQGNVMQAIPRFHYHPGFDHVKMRRRIVRLEIRYFLVISKKYLQTQRQSMRLDLSLLARIHGNLFMADIAQGAWGH